MATTKRTRPVRMNLSSSLCDLTCPSSCTKPCSAYQDFALTQFHSVRVYSHQTADGVSYLFKPSNDTVWCKSDDSWYTFTLLAGTELIPILELQLDGVAFDCAQSADGRALQLLIGCRHRIETQETGKSGSPVLRFGTTCNAKLMSYYGSSDRTEIRLSNLFDSTMIVFLSAIVLYHLLNTRYDYVTQPVLYLETIYLLIVQSVATILFVSVHCVAFPDVFSRRIHTFAKDTLAFLLMASSALAIYFLYFLDNVDWLVVVLQEIVFWVCVKVCLERKV